MSQRPENRCPISIDWRNKADAMEIVESTCLASRGSRVRISLSPLSTSIGSVNAMLVKLNHLL